MAALKKKLCVGMCVLILVQAPVMLFGEGRGFFFNGSGVFDFAPALAQNRGETLYRNQVGLGGVTLGAGYNFSFVELSLNSGWGLNTQYPAYDETAFTGVTTRKYVKVESHAL